jgi:transposase
LTRIHWSSRNADFAAFWPEYFTEELIMSDLYARHAAALRDALRHAAERGGISPLGVLQQGMPAVHAHNMTTVYKLGINEHCAQAEIVYDLFHVVAQYGHDVIDRVRVHQANQLRHDRPACEVLKSSRWLLRNRRNPKPEQWVPLEEELGAKGQGAVDRAGVAKRHRRSATVCLALFSGTESWRAAVIHSIPVSLNASITLKVIKRRACGYRDEEYFFLKIRAAFPGKPR